MLFPAGVAARVTVATINAQNNAKRHRAAALHDAVAFSRTPLPPQGFGVRQPHAAFIARRPDRSKDLMVLAFMAVSILCSSFSLT
jgi:hypothetical protein